MRQEWVFAISYDLLLYWAMGYSDDYRGLCDWFWGADNSFDAADADVWMNATPVYFLHGALHLVVEGSGRTRKLKRTGQTLLDQFGRPIAGDPQARPLTMSRGSDRYVQPNRRHGGWDVITPGHKRPTAHAATRAEAVERAREIVHGGGGGARSASRMSSAN